MTQRHSETHKARLYAIMTRRRRMTQRRSKATIVGLYISICSTSNQLFAIRSDLSRQRLSANRRIEATGTSTCITIGFVQTTINLVNL